MSTKGINDLLYEKMAAEQQTFRAWLKAQPPDEILNHAAEFTVREDILMEMRVLNLPEQQAAALLASPTPLEDVYQEWNKVETHHMEDIRDMIESCTGEMLKENDKRPLEEAPPVPLESLLSQPLKREDIKAEAQRILTEFQNAKEPNSPSGTHYMAQISQNFLVRASTKDHDRLMAMLPFQSLVFSSLVGRDGLFALISKDENRTKPLRLRKSSVRKKLQEKPDTPKPPKKGKATGQEL